MALQLIGRSVPLGATIGDGGVNFSLFSRSCYGRGIGVFRSGRRRESSRVVALDPVANRTCSIWHVLVPSVRPRADLRLPRIRPVRPGQRAAL